MNWIVMDWQVQWSNTPFTHLLNLLSMRWSRECQVVNSQVANKSKVIDRWVEWNGWDDRLYLLELNYLFYNLILRRTPTFYCL